MSVRNIAIDGPAGAGKSTIARRLAAMCGLIYVDTGAMYRTLALFCSRNEIDVTDEEAVGHEMEKAQISLAYEDGVQHIYLNGEDVSALIRQEEIGKMASAVSVHPSVRSRMVEMQKKLATERSVVMDGRDIGTVVLPDAFLKIFLTASPEERARRRAEEMTLKGMPCDVKIIEADIRERDERDRTRKVGPLKQAEDAVLIDSTKMNIEEVAAAILNLYEERCREEQ